MAHTDKDLPYWVQALQSPFAEDDHYACENDPLGRVVRETHIEEREIAPHWHRQTRLVPHTFFGYESASASTPIYDENLDCYFREVEQYTYDDDGNVVTTVVRQRVRNYEVFGMRQVTEWVFAPKYVHEVVIDREYVRECDIDGPAKNRPRRSCRRWGHPQPGHRYYWAQGPRAEERHLLFYGPERAHVRDVLRQAVDDYNTYGETDIEPEPRQTRHATWYGGWWD